MATLDDINETLTQIQLLLAQQLTSQSPRGKVETTGGGVISASTGNVTLNPSYFYDIAIKLKGATTTDTNVFVTVTTLQTQNPAKYPLNTTNDKLLLKGVKGTSVFTDSTLTDSQSLYVYFIGYDAVKDIGIDISDA